MDDDEHDYFGDADTSSQQDDHEEEVEEARNDGYAAGESDCQTRAFGCGCLVGILLTLTAFYMGWCSPYTR